MSSSFDKRSRPSSPLRPRSQSALAIVSLVAAGCADRPPHTSTSPPTTAAASSSSDTPPPIPVTDVPREAASVDSGAPVSGSPLLDASPPPPSMPEGPRQGAIRQGGETQVSGPLSADL